MKKFTLAALLLLSVSNVYSWIRDGFSWLTCIASVLSVLAFVLNAADMLKRRSGK